MAAERSYQSPLREAQAGMTRERLFLAAKAHLETDSIESLTLRRLAALSGVSAPTVYAHFPTMDDLVVSFFHWLRPRLALDRPLPPLAELPSMPARVYPLYDQYGALLRNLMNQPAWERVRAADRDVRLGRWIAEIGRSFPKLKPAPLRRGALAIASYWAPTHWRWLTDTAGFAPEEAQQVASWSIRALIAALANDPAGLDRPADHQPKRKNHDPSHLAARPRSGARRRGSR